MALGSEDMGMVSKIGGCAAQLRSGGQEIPENFAEAGDLEW